MDWSWIVDLWDKGSLAAAGAAGGVVRWLTLREKFWPDGLISIVVGSLAAFYLADYLEPAFPVLFRAIPWLSEVDFDQGKLGSLAGFVVGMSGIVLAGVVLDFVNFGKREGGK